MTDKQQALAIAKICGWTYDATTEQMVFIQGGDICGVSWPSLDAMAEAEDTLTLIQMTHYVSILRNIAAVEGFWAESAKAKWRAKAFLGVHDLWRD